MRQLQLAAATLLLASGTAFAAPDERPGRYTLTPTDNGFLRLDTESGAVSLCNKKDGAWACDPVADGEKALRKEIEGLKSENKLLKDDVKRLEDVVGIGDPKPGEGPPSEPRPGAQGKLQLPTEKDVDKAFDYFEAMMKKLRERLKRLEDSQKPGTQL